MPLPAEKKQESADGAHEQNEHEEKTVRLQRYLEACTWWRDPPTAGWTEQPLILPCQDDKRMQITQTPLSVAKLLDGAARKGPLTREIIRKIITESGQTA
jgi:hypothetical protein